MTTRELGRTGIHVTPIGLGCMQIASRGIVSALFPAQPQADIDAIIKAALDGGINWFDTAEMYGGGGSERALSSALISVGIKPGDVTVATKWTPLGRTAKNIERTIDDRLAALSPFPVDLHQIHQPFGSLSSLRAQVRAMARLVEAHEIAAVGVSNFSAKQMEAAHTTLSELGIPLATNQVQINLLHRDIETNGVLETARRLGITLIAYSPLREGILTGKFHDDPGLVAKMPRLRRTVMRISSASIDRSAPLIDGLREMAGDHGASPSQIALAWVIQNYGDTVVAIPGASKPRHAEEAAGAMKIHLSDDELRRLADLSSSVTG